MKTKEDLALERLKGTLLAEGYWQDVLEDFAVIETALNNYYKLLGENEETTKKLKALEIIEEKEINIHALLLHLKRFDSPNGYNVLVGEKYKITQEEYDLLKEVLL